MENSSPATTPQFIAYPTVLDWLTDNNIPELRNDLIHYIEYRGIVKAGLLNNGRQFLDGWLKVCDLDDDMDQMTQELEITQHCNLKEHSGLLVSLSLPIYINYSPNEELQFFSVYPSSIMFSELLNILESIGYDTNSTELRELTTATQSVMDREEQQEEVTHAPQGAIDLEFYDKKRFYTLKELCWMLSGWEIPLEFDEQLNLESSSCSNYYHQLTDCLKGNNSDGFVLAAQELWIKTYDFEGPFDEPASQKVELRPNHHLKVDKVVDPELTIVSKSEFMRWLEHEGIQLPLTEPSNYLSESPEALTKQIAQLELEKKELEKKVCELTSLHQKQEEHISTEAALTHIENLKSSGQLEQYQERLLKLIERQKTNDSEKINSSSWAALQKKVNQAITSYLNWAQAQTNKSRATQAEAVKNWIKGHTSCNTREQEVIWAALKEHHNIK